MAVRTDFSAALYRKSPIFWRSAERPILSVALACFGGEMDWDAQSLEEAFERPDSIAVLLKGFMGRIVGFTFGWPTHECGVCDHPQKNHRRFSVAPTACGRCPCSGFKQTFNVYLTAIHPDFQHRGLVGEMMVLLEKALLRRNIGYLTGNAVTSNGFAATIERHYGPQIVESAPVEEWFDLKYFKIRLEKQR